MTAREHYDMSFCSFNIVSRNNKWQHWTTIILTDGKYLVIKSDSATASLIIPTPLIPFTVQPSIAPRSVTGRTPCWLVQVHPYRNKDTLIWSAETTNQAAIKYWNHDEKSVEMRESLLYREIIRDFLLRVVSDSDNKKWLIRTLTSFNLYIYKVSLFFY